MDIQSLLAHGQHIEITAWKSEQDEEGHTFLTTIELVEGDQCLVIPPPHQFALMQALLKPPMIVGALYSHPPDLLVFYPVVKRSETEIHKGFWLRVEKHIEYQVVQRREFVRVKTRRKITVQMPPKWLDLEAYTIDLSGGGVQFASHLLFSKGEQIRLRFPVKGQAKPLELLARTISCHTNPFSHDAAERYATSCQFLHLTEQQRTWLMGECFRIQLEQKRHLSDY